MTSPKTISMFIPCLVDQVYPEIGMAMARVIKTLGYSVSYNPEQVCCGQPAYNAGHLEESRQVAEHFCTCFDAEDTIVCPSGSCTSMVRNHFQTLFEDHPSRERSESLSKRVLEFSEFLVKENLIDQINGRLEARAVFHCSCHSLRELGIDRNVPLSVLERIKGLSLVFPDGPHKCCGFGGLFYLKYPDVADNMTRQRLDQLLDTDAEMIISNDPGCIMVLKRMLTEQGRSIEVVHIAEVLDRAMS